MKPLNAMKRPRRLVATIDGRSFTGKTHLMLSMPPPACIFSIDRGLEGVVEDMTGAGYDFSRFEVEDYSLDRPPVSSRAALDHAKTTIAKFRASWREVMKRTTRHSVGIDTGSEFWQLLRLADLGKLSQVPPMRYVRVNSIFRDLIGEIMDTPHNLVMIHRETDLYDSQVIDTNDGPKEVSIRVPGEVKREGFKQIDELVQVVLRSQRRERKSGKVEMGFTVRKCRQRAALMGQSYWGEFATFGHLGLDVFPDSSPADWGLE